MKSKLERHRIIKEVVGNGRVSSQEELASILEKEGLQVAQATLSRDIRELGITKMHDGDSYYYCLPGTSRFSPRRGPDTSYSIISIEFSGQLAVIKTQPGHANMVASLIDMGGLDEIAGTIAGDDTILLAIREGKSRDALSRSLEALFNGIGRKRLN